MRRLRKLGAAVALVALVAALGAAAGCGDSDTASDTESAAADTTKAYKIGITQIVTHPALDAAVSGFKAALAEKGFTNITYDDQNAQGDMATASSIAQKFAGAGLDLILGVATPTAQAVVKADQTTPIVFTAVTDPVGAGLIADPEAPSANVTGVSDMLPVEPHLELIKQVVPDAKTVGVIYNAGEANSVFLIEAEKEAASGMGLEIVEATASNSSEVQAAAESLVGRVDAISVLTDNTAVSALESIIKVGEQNGIPVIAGDTDSVKRGAVAAYAFDYEDLGKQAGYQAAAILMGTPIKDIPVEYAENLQLSINEKAASRMGVTISEDLKKQAQNSF
ncbi:MAG: ABC transporter substrate-binding protein [Actinobacteria bacterium]|nr:ABC transporter substrate-binding protein [Actinomycetota bacterium]